ncbi:hypothetical protein IQ254_22225 [Nodosilinea sp. LEGE 07088]|uniref:hypothetical protein n=1 Tax=Nodosilinea sp. LEGE 07088 TaxID=2777968 RepID=UPI00187E80A5|nr:hypothetical protein [Nodosilinea sp. LEGE 07088]MBE9139878.1 hypothetical protein [Nodosilinea sp. LEGE 07088]
MTPLEQIQQDIQTLPQDALDLLAQFIQLLKKSQSVHPENRSGAEPSSSSDAADWSDLIGCMDAEADLSVNYKTYLLNGLEQKYGHH